MTGPARFILTWILILSAGLTEAQTELRYVRSAADLKIHFTLHIRRVVREALVLYDRHPEEFGSVSRSDVREFVEKHDETKVNDTPEFRQTYWIGDQSAASFNERLFAVYGKEAEKQLIQDLNATDKKVAYTFLQSKGYLNEDGTPNDKGKTLLRLERIADVLDRHLDPTAREEFGIEKKKPLSLFLQDPRDLELALELTKSYQKDVIGLRYIDQMGGHLPHCTRIDFEYKFTSP